MFDVNVKIISELKNFITIVSKNRGLLNKFCVADSDFTRTRKLPFERLALLITRLCKKTLSVELEKFFEEMNCSTSYSVSAFTQQRSKLAPVFFHYCNIVLERSFYVYCGDAIRRWKGFRVIAADGSNLSLTNNRALSDHFGGQRNQHMDFVQAKTFYHYDVLNEIVILSQIKPYRHGEMKMAYDAVNYLQDDMLTIYDRYYCNYKMAALHIWQETEKKFVIRAKESLNMIKAFVKSGEVSSIIEMRPTACIIKEIKKSGFIVTSDTVIKVRLVRVELPHSTEVLMTNLWETEGHAVEQFKDLYFMRWGIETNISVQKNILQLESFSGLTVDSVMQDFYATVLITNLHSLIIKNAQHTVDDTMGHRKYPMKINKNKSFGRLKMNLVSLFVTNNVEKILQDLSEYFIKELIPVRKGRSFKRVRKNPHSKGKYKTFTNFKPSY